MIYANLSAWITVKKYYLGKVRQPFFQVVSRAGFRSKKDL